MLGLFALRKDYRVAVERRLPGRAPAKILTESDAAHLPPQVRRYLVASGAIGAPQVDSFFARFRGRIRRAPGEPWMAFTAEQHSFVEPATRLFLMSASRAGIPFDALHVYDAGKATMQVQVAGLLKIVDARGPEMDRSETVTMLNDLCLLAPSSLVTPRLKWDELDSSRVGVTFATDGVTVQAELMFGTDGMLRDFVSRDRSMSADGKSFVRAPWSTPIAEHRRIGDGRTVVSRASAIWELPSGAYPYGEFELEQITYNVDRAARP